MRSPTNPLPPQPTPPPVVPSGNPAVGAGVSTVTIWDFMVCAADDFNELFDAYRSAL